MSDELHTPGYWMTVLRRIRFADARDGVSGAMIKAVATALAGYADFEDGTNIRPGTARLAVDCEIDYRTAKRCIAVLREIGLIKLVRKASRRHHSDEYRLDLPEDLLERKEIEVWDPQRYAEEIERLRVKHRGRYVSKAARDGSNDDDLQGMGGTAEAGPEGQDPADLRGTQCTAETQSAGHAVPDLRGTVCPPTNQEHQPGVYQPKTSEDQVGDVLVPGDLPEDQDPVSPPIDLVTRPRCDHGRSTRRTSDGRLRCVDCRAAEEAAAEQDTCGHGVNIRYRCPACARGLAGGEP